MARSPHVTSGTTIESSKQNALIDDYLSQTDTAVQDIASNVRFAAGKRPRFNFAFFKPFTAPENTEGYVYYDNAAHILKLRNDAAWLNWVSAHSDLSGIGSDDHHAQTHKDTHKTGGGDALTVSDLLDAIARTTVRKDSGANIGSRRRLNFIQGSNVTLTVADDAANEEVDVTVAASPGGSGEPHIPCSYLVYLDGSIYKARNGSTGNIDYSNASLKTVLDSCRDALTSGGIIFLSLVGEHSLSQFSLGNYPIIYRGLGCKTTILKQTSNADLMTLTGGGGAQKQPCLQDVQLRSTPTSWSSSLLKIAPSGGHMLSWAGAFRDLTFFREAGNKEGNLVKIAPSAAYGVHRLVMDNVFFRGLKAGEGLKLDSTGASGAWINGNHFGNLFFYASLYGLRMVCPSPVADNKDKMDANIFHGVNYQYNTSITKAFSVQGYKGLFHGVMTYDIPASPAGTSFVFETNTLNNQIFGHRLWPVGTDSGTGNSEYPAF